MPVWQLSTGWAAHERSTQRCACAAAGCSGCSWAWHCLVAGVFARECERAKTPATKQCQRAPLTCEDPRHQTMPRP
eukprot:349832-Chlamydomonas_euryale.AAC.1